MKLPDLWLLIPAFLLTSISLLITSTVSPAEFSFQWKVALISILLAILISQVDSELIYLIAKPFYWLCILLLVVLLVINDPIRGSRRWLSIGPLTIQVSEFAKMAVVLFLASTAMRQTLRTVPKFIFALAIVAIPFLLVFLQPDLGSSIIVAVSGGLALLTLKPKKRYIAAVFITFILLVPLLLRSLAPYQRARVEHFINPSKDPLGASYNQIQAVIAVGSGQMIGKGLGRGTQSRLEFLPEKQTDFFFATASEQLGFVGSTIIILLYSALAWRAVALARQIQSKPARTLVYGSLALLFFQPVIHIGINLGILPVTGIPLPFLSVGGSSLLVSWLTVGMMMAIEKDNRDRMAFDIV